MSSWREPLELEIPELFLYDPQPEFPSLEPPETGARLRLVDLAYDGAVLSFRALITFNVTHWQMCSLQRLEAAFVMTIEDAASGRAGALNLLDPHKEYEPLEGPNFQPQPQATEREGCDVGGYIELPIVFEASPPSFRGPSIFVSINFFASGSNVVAIDVEEVRSISYLDAEPWQPRLLADEDADVLGEEEDGDV